MGRKKKWRTKSHRAMASDLRKEINPNTNKPWTDFEIMQKFGYFNEERPQKPDLDKANNASNARKNKDTDETKLGAGINIDSEFVENLLVSEYILSEGSPSKELRAHMMDFWKAKHKVPDETNFDETLDLTELIDIATSHSKPKEASNELDQDTVSD